ncbi:chromate efflux transporter [Aquisalimonas asiatica]|uniref:Chromate transporter n=1 Tax=Aquisalimonas asiatica TaxID=406100 RepID=A0A1H8SSQ6_9GAMM|nr:chromate efflux transporter [Aquisalimonas asiatica]SEO81526.1 chromate transporter [Aquisalimonas asiatica]
MGLGPEVRRRSALEVFLVFLGLGLSSFGGPVAHLGYYREALVQRRQWLSDQQYGQIVALCQFLPGPSSSQVGQAIGLLRAGLPGLFAAWLGFTLPSAIIMIGLAVALGTAGPDALTGAGWLHGLKLAAVAVVAHAVINMARSLAPDWQRVVIVVAATAVALLWANPFGQLSALVMGGLLAFLLPMQAQATAGNDGLDIPIGRRTANVSLLLFVVALCGLPLLATAIPGGLMGLIDGVFRAGSLVFGGGHVVLPLLEREVAAPAGVDTSSFLAGYGVAQALPGPLFSFAGYLGAEAQPHMPIIGGVIAVIAIFLPGTLLLMGVLPWWGRISGIATIRRAVAGVNAGVVGLLAAILWDPVIRIGITGLTEFAIAAVAFALLMGTRFPVYLLVPACAAAGWLLL